MAGHTRAECALRDHPALGRWLHETPSGRLVIDTAKVHAEARLDGKYLLVNFDPDLTPRTSRWATRTCWRPNAASGT